jgi:hypothetical protein
LRAQRAEEGLVVAGIIPKRCLDKCDRAATVIVKTPDGAAGISEATPEAIEAAVTAALG